MTRMSDALRGAAETAPVTNVHVSSAAAASRVRRTRMLRTSANGIVGVGAAALVVAGVMGAIANQTGIAAATGSETSRDMAGNGDNPAMSDVAPEPGVVDPTVVACGTSVDFSQFPAGNVAASATLDDKDVPILLVKLTYSSATTDPVALAVPTHYVVWQDIVVATAQGDAVPGSWDPAATPALEATSGIKLNNCWDAADLPAGDYTVVTVTPVSADVPPVAEPTAAPVEPSTAPEPTSDPTTDPDAAVSSDTTADIAVAPLTYAVTDAVPYTVPGEAVANPFEEYLKVVDPEPVPTIPAGPDDALTSAQALAAYNAALTSDRWTMEKGTQRVVMTSSSDDTTGAMWAQTYFGCPTEGTNAGFPAESAKLDWLQVNAQLPGSVHVSYGWVVDGNPVVSYSVKNVTDWSLPGFYAGSSPRLVLVKEGKVVAEAYPVNPDQQGGAIAYAADTTMSGGAPSSNDAAARDSLIWAPASDGYLAPGDSVGGEYLWRDLNGCWTNNGPSQVSPGKYTVLTAQDMYVGGQYAVLEDKAAATDAPLVGSDDGSSGDVTDAIAPIAPDSAMDYASFQVWTSLGTVTVSN